jgi:NAD+ kinase
VISRIGLVVRPDEGHTRQIQAAIADFAQSRGIEIGSENPDLVVSLGGDGTMLRAAQEAHRHDALLLGVNLGTLGYLTEIDAGQAIQALDEVVNGRYRVEERMMLSCSSSGGTTTLPAVGLNEVLIERALRNKLVRLSVRVGDERLATFGADGVIIATPTGSTAYALSAGGPIVSPRAEVLIIVPVSAHMVFSRPIVLAPDETVEVTVDGSGVQASLVLDGADGTTVDAGTSIKIERHPRPLRLVRLSGPGFLERLRSKMGLPD